MVGGPGWRPGLFLGFPSEKGFAFGLAALLVSEKWADVLLKEDIYNSNT
jgi:hypothetical protein